MTPRSRAAIAITTAALAASAVPAVAHAQPAAPSASPGPGGASDPRPTASRPDDAGGGVRFRGGASLLGGPLVLGVQGGAVGIDARFGAQITNLVGVYAQPVAMVGAGGVVDEQGFSAAGGFFAAAGAGALVDFTIDDFFFFAIGPEFMAVDLTTVAVSLHGGGSAAESGTYVSVTGRIGVALGSMKPERRKALTLGLHPRVVLTSIPFFVATLAVGYDAF